MLQLQSHPHSTDAVDVDRKVPGVSAIVVSDRSSTNAVNQEQQPSSTQKGRLDKAVIRFSSFRTAIQILLTIPSFAVELYYGIYYLNQCPIQPLINVFLIVHGSASLVNGIDLLLGYIAANYIKRSPSPSPYARRLLAVSLLGQLVFLLFSVAWLIVGQVWVFGAQTNGFQSSNASQSSTYCHPNVFWCGFVIIIITYAIWLILILVIVGRLIMKRHQIKQQTTSTTDGRY